MTGWIALALRRTAGPLVAGLLCMVPGPAPATIQDAFASVVVVLPAWPGRPDNSEEPEGTGVAIARGGYVVTNVHVLGRARQVDVRLSDGRLAPAEIIGRDPPTDIAVLKIDQDLPVLPRGPEPAIADPVCAIGNQFGLGLSVTCGVVSAIRRSGTGFNPIEDFIQTDAAINPGASGGALLDAKGRLVGIVSAIFTKQSDANIGVNFAASTALVDRVADDLIALGAVQRGRPGFRTADLPRKEQRRTAGVLIEDVTPAGAAAAAGLREGDILVAIAGRDIRHTSDVAGAIQLHRPGETLEVRVLRNGQPLTTALTLAP